MTGYIWLGRVNISPYIFAERRCKQKCITVNELANLSGVTPSTAYSMLDENRRDVSIVTIKKFCDGIDVSLQEFFSGEEFDTLEQEVK